MQSLLRTGVEQFDVERGFLNRIDLGLNDHTVVQACPEADQEKTDYGLEATFCRKAVISSSPLSVHDAPNQGWAHDRAYEEWGFHTYLGTKLVVSEHLYGTVCFASTDPRPSPFTENDHRRLADIAEDLQAILEDDDLIASRAELNASHALLRRVQQVSQVGGWELHLDDNELVWTEETYRLHDVPSSYTPTLPAALNFYPQDVRASLQDALRACKQSGQSFDKTLPLITANEARRWVRVRGMPYRNDGSITRITGTIQDVTQKHRMKAALKRENELLDRVFETSPSAIAILNHDGEFVRVSTRAEQILGLQDVDITGRAYDAPEWSVMTPAGDPLPPEALPFARVRDSQESVIGMQHAIEWPDGSRRLLSVSGAPLFGNDGSFAGAVMHMTDITARRETELSLRESEERFRSVFTDAALGMALLDAEGRIVEANPAFQDMFEGGDGPPRPFTGEPFDAFRADPTNAVTDALPADAGARRQREEQYRRRDDTTFWGHLTLSRVEGPGTGRIVAMIEDITRRKAQEERLRIFRKAIEQTHEAVLIFEGAPRTKPGPPIAYGNSAFTALTGYTARAIRGRSFTFLHGPETSPHVLRDLWSAFKYGRRHEGEAICRRRDNSLFVNRWSFAPVRNHEGDITHWISVQRDVTEQRDTERRLLMAHDEERRRIDREIHDEMGGLLTHLQMTVEMARLDSSTPAVPNQHLDAIEERVSELATVTRTISRRLHPRALSEHGLPEALSRLRNTLESRHDLNLTLDMSLASDMRFPSLVELTAYRVVQEVLVQATRRAAPSSATITVGAEDSTLHVLVTADDEFALGDAAHAYDALNDLTEWVECLDGHLEAHTTDAHETRVAATLPLTVSALPQAQEK